jgi:hypothetical protein
MWLNNHLTKIKTFVPGKYTNIFDGQVCQELLSEDGSLFFSPSDKKIAAGELCIGVLLGIDWCVMSLMSFIVNF